MEFMLGFIFVLGVCSMANPDRILDGSLRDVSAQIGGMAAVLVFVAVSYAHGLLLFLHVPISVLLYFVGLFVFADLFRFP